MAEDDDFGTETPQQVEAAVVSIFRELFEGNEIGPSDDFFDLGGDSLLATTLVTAIERDLDVVLPPSVLLEAPTPHKLAESVVAAREHLEANSLVPVRPEGKGPPMFCVHGTPGDTIYIRKLARAIGGVRPVYGLRAMGLRSGEAILPSVEEMASGYLAEIRAVQPAGPYVVVGQCRTAVIALELAAQMTAQNEEVPGLILLDPAIGEGLTRAC
jgi:acyl carrier protein